MTPTRKNEMTLAILTKLRKMGAPKSDTIPLDMMTEADDGEMMAEEGPEMPNEETLDDMEFRPKMLEPKRKKK